jgi:transposase-like protein
VGWQVAFSKVLKFGGKVMKVVTDFQDTVKTGKENLDQTKMAADDIGDVRVQGRNPIHSTMSKLTRKKRKGHLNFSPIPQPETENKEEIYEWIYKECTNIFSQLRENIKETCELNPQYRKIKFRIFDDMLIFHVPSDLGDDWGYFKDYVQLESFALQSRLEKLNKYNFDHEDLKRITEAKEKVKSLCHPPSNFSLANRFYKTDKLLAAYFSRESLMKLLFRFTTEEEYEKRMIHNSQTKMDVN